MLGTGPALIAASCSRQAETEPGRDSRGKIRVAAILTSFFYRSHAHVILENFLVPYLFNGETVDPTAEFEVMSFYVDQFPPDDAEKPDMARDISQQFGIPIFPTIADALTLGGGKLAVDAVLMIAEHGDYPFNEKGQELYPKKRFFDEIVAVFEHSGRSVPVYCDKHLSHSWTEAKEMVDTSRRLGFGLMAGSSVPLSQRIPPLDLGPDQVYRMAVSIHGGPLERYGFHGLEILQSMVENRPEGETGIRSVQAFEGEAFWKANAFGVWNATLVQSALRAEFGKDVPALEDLAAPIEPEVQPAHGFQITYRDGLSSSVLKLGTKGDRWNFACWPITDREPLATRFNAGPWNNRNLFKALAHAIQHHFRTGTPPYPIERTLLVTGAL
ncbi:MAG: hypothetical protein KDA42_12515, partial [Planctomycetales bacterium]|nr:hypothetical protein [Planctomycetales bacterium]